MLLPKMTQFQLLMFMLRREPRNLFWLYTMTNGSAYLKAKYFLRPMMEIQLPMLAKPFLSNPELDFGLPSLKIRNIFLFVFLHLHLIDVSGKMGIIKKVWIFLTISKIFTRNPNRIEAIVDQDPKLCITWPQRLNGKRPRRKIMPIILRLLKWMVFTLMLLEYQADWLKQQIIFIKYVLVLGILKSNFLILF